MTGKTHKAIGFAVGTAMTIYAVRSNTAVYALGMLTAPLGAMIPDIDHDHTKLGKARKKVVDAIRISAVVADVLTVLATMILVYSGRMDMALKLLIAVTPTTAVVLVATSETFKKKFPFLMEHRGIMHTLVFPALMVIGAVSMGTNVLSSLLLGLGLGYVSHLFADSLTVMGVPVAFPITKECYHILPIRTGTKWEYIVGGVVILLIIVYGCFCDGNSSNALLVAVPLLFIFSRAISDKMWERIKRSRRSAKALKVIYAIAAVVMVLIFIISKELVYKVVSASAIIGWCVGMLDNLKRRR